MDGVICDNTLDFRRFAWNEVLPSSLETQFALLKNEYGTDEVPWKMKGLTHPKGWTTTLITGKDYELSFKNFSQLTNITYNGGFYEFEPEDYVRMKHVFKQEPDYFKTVGTEQEFSKVEPPTSGNHGDWGFVNNTKTQTYLVTGKENTNDVKNNLETKDIRARGSGSSL